ncbi:hypothetical protein MRB53_003988 [Persea americana]|uniref:Uncharacterized protein n=1 Tax=Persea americana TaxID=3435 RepID=A0ACC2MYY9_PERAE|nr:hypothetical protein MRB53_003988 [Persea americana]
MATDEALYFTDSNGDGTYLIFILEIESSHVFQILPKLITGNLVVDSMSAVHQIHRKVAKKIEEDLDDNNDLILDRGYVYYVSLFFS